MSREAFIKMRGAWDARHWISIPSLSHQADGLQIERQLGRSPGIRAVHVFVASKKIRVTYDQTAIDFNQILENLSSIGFPVAGGWWWRKKAAWFQYLDSNAKSNAEAPSPPCCSNPKGLGASTRNDISKHR